MCVMCESVQTIFTTEDVGKKETKLKLHSFLQNIHALHSCQDLGKGSSIRERYKVREGYKVRMKKKDGPSLGPKVYFNIPVSYLKVLTFTCSGPEIKLWKLYFIFHTLFLHCLDCLAKLSFFTLRWSAMGHGAAEIDAQQHGPP